MPFQFAWIARRRSSAGVGASGSANAGAGERNPPSPRPADRRSSAPRCPVSRTGPNIGSFVTRFPSGAGSAAQAETATARMAGNA
jgi:hypothetical protein